MRAARPGRPRPVARAAQPRRRCSSSSTPPTRRALVELGELPPHGRRVARGRDAGDRDGGRRRRGGRPRRRERPARPSRGSGRPRRGGSALLRTTKSFASGCARAAARSVDDVRAERVFGELEATLQRVGAMKPRVLFVARTRYRCRSTPSLARKWDALREELDLRVLAAGAGRGDAPTARSSSRARCRPRGARRRLFYARLPLRHRARAAPVPAGRRDRAERARDCGRACRARARAQRHAVLVVDVHGDWRAPRACTARAARRARARSRDALATRGVRRADGVRTVSGYTTGLVRELGVEPAGDLPAVHGPRARSSSAAASRCRTGRRRSSSACSSATRTSTGSPRRGGCAAPRVPEARLPHRRRRARCATLVDALVARPAGADALDAAAQHARGRRAALDESTLLVLPSRSEGMGRVVVEALLPRPARRRQHASAASPISSRTASTACSSSRATPRRSRTRSSASSPTASSPSGSAPARARAPSRGRLAGGVRRAAARARRAGSQG